MGDQQHAAVGCAHDAVDARADDPQRVDVEPAVGLVQHGEARAHDAHLDHLHPLLLAAREADVDRPLEHLDVHAQFGAFRLGEADEFCAGEISLAARTALGVEALADELHARDAGDFHRILEAEEQAGGGAFVGFEGEEVERSVRA